MALTPAEQAMWANARQRGAALIGCGLLCAAVTVLTMRILRDTFYIVPVLIGPPAVLLGLVLVIVGNRARPPQWAHRAVLASCGVGLVLGMVCIAYLRGSL
jgi:hypothetical protein